MTTTNSPRVIALRHIKCWKPCGEQFDLVAQLYPDGVPCTVEAALRLHDAGVDVLWGALRLLTKEERGAFILFTLRQRQPHVATLLRAIGLEEHAAAVAALRFETVEDALAEV